MGVGTKRSRQQDESRLLERRQAAGYQFFVVEQGEIRLPVLARCANQATGVFLAWRKLSLRTAKISSEPFACIGIHEVLPAEYNHYAVYCGRRHGRPYIKIVRHTSQS